MKILIDYIDLNDFDSEYLDDSSFIQVDETDLDGLDSLEQDIYENNVYEKIQEYKPLFREEGQEAVNKLLKEKKGWCPRAFYRDDTKYISLMYGNKSFGLKHILNKHPEVVNKLNTIITKGKTKPHRTDKTRVIIQYKQYVVSLQLGYKLIRSCHEFAIIYVITGFDTTVNYPR